MVETQGPHEPMNETSNQMDHLSMVKSEQEQQAAAECALLHSAEDQLNHKVSKLKGKEKKRRRKKKRPPHKSKMITGYIIYASEIRKDVIKKYPDQDFGHISKLVGIEWKNLPQETKVAYEKRAQEQNAKSKAIAAEAFELKKLADAAEEKAREQALQQLPAIHTNGDLVANGYSDPLHLDAPSAALKLNSHSHLGSPLPHLYHQQHQLSVASQSPIKISLQQPLQIIHQQQQPVSTTVQYCNNNITNGNCDSSPLICNSATSFDPSQSPHALQRNTIVYRKPATVRLKPRDALTQTEPIQWVASEPKKALRFSQTFIDYLSQSFSA